MALTSRQMPDAGCQQASFGDWLNAFRFSWVYG